MISFANAFDPSSIAAAALGPKHAIPASRTASATPATRGASGPMTTRSTPSFDARAATAAGSEAVNVVEFRDVADAGIAGRGVKLGHPGIGSKRAGDGVLTSTGTDDENLHGRHSTGATRGVSRGCRRA